MTAAIHSIDHPAHRHTPRIGAQRIVSMVAAATRRARTADNLGTVGSHAGQLGPLHESEIGRRTGARI